MRLFKWTIIETSKLDEIKKQVCSLREQMKTINDWFYLQRAKEESKKIEPELEFTFEKKEKPTLVFTEKFTRNDEMYKNRIRMVYEMLPFNELLNLTMIRFYTSKLNLSEGELYYAIDFLVKNNYIAKQSINKYIIH